MHTGVFFWKNKRSKGGKMEKELHITRLTMLWRCGEQYYRRYVKGEIVPPGIALIVGSGTHKSVEENLKSKAEKKEMLPKDVVKDIARDYIEKNLLADNVLLNEEEKEKAFDVIKGEAKDTAVSLSELHYDKLAPKISPVAVEKPFSLEIEGEDEFTIAGKIDIIEKGRIRDTKTSSRKMPGQADKSLQLTMYALAENINEKKEIKKVCLDFLIKTKELSFETQESTRDKKDFDVLINRISNALKQLKAGIFPPTNPENWWCSPKFCGYFNTCKYVKNK